MTHTTWLFALTLTTSTTLCATALAQTPDTNQPIASRTLVTLRILPQDASVTLDGVPIDSSQPLYVLPGTHVLRVEAPGYIPREETLRIADQPGREILMSINLSAQPSAPDVSMRSEGLIAQMDYGRPITGWIMTGAGAALITTSIVLAVRSSAPESSCTDQTMPCGVSQDLAGWATFTGVLGGASLLGGLTLLSWRSLAGEPQPLGADSASLSLDGSGLLLRVQY